MLLQWVIAAVLVFFCSESEARIVQTAHIQDVLPLIDEETWFLVDIDNCLFEAAQALGHANWFYDEMQKTMERGKSREEAIAEAYPGWIKTQKVCKVKPLEEGFVPVLQELQKRGVPIMAVTHRQPSVADSTVKQVHSLGFDFLVTAPSKESFVVAAHSPTLYRQGILFVSDYNKKIDVFENFLKEIQKSPKKVVFIDDKRKNVEELEKLASRLEYIGVHYTAIEHTEPLYSREIAEFQSRFLDQIMSNEAALLLMEHGLE